MGVERTGTPERTGGGLARALEAAPTGQRPRFDREGQALVGGRCADCGAAAWPARAVCHRCGSAAVHAAVLARTATLLTFTEVHVARPGLSVPYTLGQVRLDEGGPLLFGQVRGRVAEADLPCPVRIAVGPSGGAAADGVEDGEPGEGERLAYWFEPPAA